MTSLRCRVRLCRGRRQGGETRPQRAVRPAVGTNGTDVAVAAYGVGVWGKAEAVQTRLSDAGVLGPAG